MLSNLPSAALRPFVERLWVAQTAGAAMRAREHLLPTGQMHLVFRVSGPPPRLYRDADDATGQTLASAVVGGARSGFYVKETGAPSVSIGAQLAPAAAQMLFGISAAELAERHTALADLWGAHAQAALDRLSAANDPRQQLALLETLLAARLPRARGLHPAVAQALHELRQSRRIDELVRASRYSHRGFIALFRQAVGLSPKRYARVLRFQKLLAALRSSAEASLGDLALATGYSDQAHMNREFREFAGVTPSQYRRSAPAAAHHVAIDGLSPQVSFLQDRTRAGAYRVDSNHEGATP
jgi:AraC-like DNA-binding protein